jgi:hypothetical protein
MEEPFEFEVPEGEDDELSARLMPFLQAAREQEAGTYTVELRDQIMLLTLEKLLVDINTPYHETDAQIIAGRCYDIADAMMERRLEVNDFCEEEGAPTSEVPNGKPLS